MYSTSFIRLDYTTQHSISWSTTHRRRRRKSRSEVWSVKNKLSSLLTAVFGISRPYIYRVRYRLSMLTSRSFDKFGIHNASTSAWKPFYFALEMPNIESRFGVSFTRHKWNYRYSTYRSTWINENFCFRRLPSLLSFSAIHSTYSFAVRN